MKKVLNNFIKIFSALFLCIALAISFAACGGKDDGTADTPKEPLRPVMEREGYEQVWGDVKGTVRRIENPQGLSIYGRVFAPVDYEFDEKMPILIMSHGNNAVGADGTNSVVKNAVANGMIVYSFDFCAATKTGKSDGEPGTATTEDEAEDLKCVIEYFKAKDYVDTSKIALWGHSRGGAVTALTIGEYYDQIAAVVLEAPAIGLSDNPLVPSETASDMNKFEKQFCVFWGDNDEQISVDTVDELKEYFGDKMLATIVPGAQHSFQPKDYQITLPIMNEYLRSMAVMPAAAEAE